MGIFENFKGKLYSKRQQELRGEVSDVYRYDELPNELKVQIVQICMKILGDHDGYFCNRCQAYPYQSIVEIVRHERGVFHLTDNLGENYLNELWNYFLNEIEVEKALDVIEVVFRIIHFCRFDLNVRSNQGQCLSPDDALQLVNSRFKEHRVGYHLVNSEIIRIDSEIIHSKVMIPAFKLLHQDHFSGPQEEFMKAHEHYRSGEFRDALTSCSKAFESVMKVICIRKGWNYNENSTANELIQICFRNELIPSFWQSQFSALRSLLESSIPTARNRLSAHGQGATPISVPDHLVAYVIHMTASTIVFLAEAEKQ